MRAKIRKAANTGEAPKSLKDELGWVKKCNVSRSISSNASRIPCMGGIEVSFSFPKVLSLPSPLSTKF